MRRIHLNRKHTYRMLITGHFTQMVWLNTKYFGIGKATSHTGKIFVVAYYYPPGKEKEAAFLYAQIH